MDRRALFGLAAAYVALQALPAVAASHAVTIKGMKFNPKTLKVAAGDTVTFTNKDSVPHTATAKDGSFDTEIIEPGKSASVEITDGTHDYFCQIHPVMKGQIGTGSSSTY